MKNVQIRCIFATIALVLVSFSSSAQTAEKPQPKKEKIEQLKIAFITKELDLTTEEAEKFWPVYNEMTTALRKEKKSRREKNAALKANYETLSDDEIEKKTLEILDSEIAEATLRKEHTEKIAKVIGYKKTVKLLSIEQRFKKELLKKLNERQGQNNQNRPNGNG
jgi:1,2-phenylacetyl-CoA epoxidase catalytic subunit